MLISTLNITTRRLAHLSSTRRPAPPAAQRLVRAMSTDPSSADALLGQSCKSLGSCSKDTPVVSKEAMQDLLKAVPQWQLSSDEKSLSRKFAARNFRTALKFLNNAGEVAEAEGHHPDMHITSYRDVELVLYTHAAGGLTMFDFIVAAKLDAIPVELAKTAIVH